MESSRKLPILCDWLNFATKLKIDEIATLNGADKFCPLFSLLYWVPSNIKHCTFTSTPCVVMENLCASFMLENHQHSDEDRL